MKKRSKNVQFKSSFIITTIAVLAIAIALFIPDGIWRPPPVSSSIGLSRYSSDVKKQPIVISTPSGLTSQPTAVSIKFRYRVSQRPSDYAYLVTTSPSPDGGIRVVMDKWGNVYLSVESKNKVKSPYQLILISGPHDLNKWLKISMFIDTSLEAIKIDNADQRIAIGEARSGHVVQINDMLLTTTNVQIGGEKDHSFDGDIKDFEMTFGSTGIRIDLINLKLFLGLITIILLGFVIQTARRKSIDIHHVTASNESADSHNADI